MTGCATVVRDPTRKPTTRTNDRTGSPNRRATTGSSGVGISMQEVTVSFAVDAVLGPRGRLKSANPGEAETMIDAFKTCCGKAYSEYSHNL